MKYKIKSNGLFIQTKDTNFGVTGEILFINWVAGLGIPVEKAVEFNEKEKDFMEKHYQNLEIMEVK